MKFFNSILTLFFVLALPAIETQAQWVQTNGPYIGADVSALAVSGTNLFAGTPAGVFLSTNNGTNWTAANSGIVAGADISAFAVVPNGTGVGKYLCRQFFWRRFSLYKQRQHLDFRQ